MEVSSVASSKRIEAIPLLSYDNYFAWEPKAIDFFRSEGVWDLVKGTRTAPTAAQIKDEAALYKARQDFNKEAMKARGLLGRILNTSSNLLIKNLDDPVAAWKKIQSSHSSSDLGQRFNKLVSLLSVEVKDGEDLKQFQDRVHNLFEDWISSLPSGQTIETLKDEILLLSLVRPLSAHHSALQAQILTKSKLDLSEISSLFNAFQAQSDFEQSRTVKSEAALAVKQERQKRSDPKRSTKPSSDTRKQSSYPPYDASKFCEVHQKKGHSTLQCESYKRALQVQSSSTSSSSAANQAVESDEEVANLASLSLKM